MAKTGPQKLIPDPTMTFTDVRTIVVRASYEPEGIICPCCDRPYKTYKQTLTAAQGYMLCWMYRKHEEGVVWVHMIEAFAKAKRKVNHHYTELHFWGLAEQLRERTLAGGPGAGLWRLTPDGRAFAEGRIDVPAYIYVRQAQNVSSERADYKPPKVTIHDISGVAWSWADMIDTARAMPSIPEARKVANPGPKPKPRTSLLRRGK